MSPTFDTVAAKIEAILPDPEVRTAQLSAFAESLSYVHDLDESGWLTHLRSDRVRLFAGRIIVMTLANDQVWMAIAAGPDADCLSEFVSWQWDTESYPEYARPPSRNGYYKPEADRHHEWAVIQKLHFAYLDQLLVGPHASDPRSISRHEPLVVEYLSKALQQKMPSQLVCHHPEEVVLPSRFWEGAVSRVTVSKFERDRKARRECLRIHGETCVICGMSFGHVYGTEVASLLHVHHVVPLSEIREGYSPDPANDLVPVCPNCHAVIHSGGATRSTSQVRALLKRNEGSG
jgi:5-methylcytosine-specific restriction endonuclease McrA